MGFLVVQNLSVSFGGVHALSGANLDVPEGMIYGLIGPNGAGKSTLFNCLSRIYDPDHGSIDFAGLDLLKVPPHGVVRLGIARTFQNTHLFHTMTVWEHILVGQHAITRSGLISSALGFRRGEKRSASEHAAKMVSFLELEKISERNVMGLPLGQQKLVELARALASKPKMLLLDEPTAGMSPVETERVRGIIHRIRDELGITILLVEHNMPLVMDICDRIMVLDFGEVIAEGTPPAIQSNQRVIEAYLGEEESSC
jgi:branched-chain amino acid transport system ATP-binding protein